MLADLDNNVHLLRAVPAAFDELLLALHTVFPKLQFKKEIMLLYFIIYIVIVALKKFITLLGLIQQRHKKLYLKLIIYM